MGGDYLRAIFKVGFETIVMRRIVACGNYCAAACFIMTHRETELRGGAWPIEDKRLPPQLRPSGCCQLTKVARKVTDIVRDDESR